MALNLGIGILGLKDELVKASLTDTTAATLIDKLTSSDASVTISLQGASGTNQKINLQVVGAGEANTGSNLGAGSQVFKQKAGVNFEYRTLTSGANITLNQSGTEIEIVASVNTIYTADDTLAGDRILTQGTNFLTFDGTAAGKVVIQNTTSTALKINSTSANSAMEFQVSGITKYTFGFFTSSNGPEIFGGSLTASFNTGTGNVAFGAVATTANTPLKIKKNSATQQTSLFDNATGDNAIMIRSGVAKISKLDFDNGSFGDTGSVWADNNGLRLRVASVDALSIDRTTKDVDIDVGDLDVVTGIYRIGGVAGVSFGPSAVTSITVVSGIITAIS